MLADEAQGIMGAIWEAVEGIRRRRRRADVHAGQPNGYRRPLPGRLRQKSRYLEDVTFTISSFDTPNLKGVTIEQVLGMTYDELAVASAPYLVTRR